MKKDIDYLHGSLFGKIFCFIIPLVLTNLVQTLYSAVDMAVVGLSGVNGAIGAVGTSVPLMHLVLNLFSGLSTGAGVVIAHSIGSGDIKSVKKSVCTAVAISLVTGILSSVVGFFFTNPLLLAMHADGNLFDLTSQYTKICFLGIPFVSVTNYLIAIFRAKGDTQLGFISLTISGLANVILNLIFVLVFKMAVSGVAIATVCSNIICCAILLFYLLMGHGPCEFKIKDLEIDKKQLLLILKNGIPAGIQSTMFSLSNVIIQSSLITVNSIVCGNGSALIDGNSAAYTLESFVSVTVTSLNAASMTISGQNYGAGLFDRLKKVVKDSYTVSVLLSVFFPLIIIIFRRPLTSFYVSDPVALATAYTRYFYILGPYIIYGFMQTGAGLLTGMNKALLSSVVSIVCICIYRIIWNILVVRPYPTLERIYIAYPISWTMAALCFYLAIRRTLENAS